MMQAAYDRAVSGHEVAMLRLQRHATSLAFVLAQDYETRAVMLIAPTGTVVIHPDITVLRQWLRHYAHCGRFGRRCFVGGRHVCRCVPLVPGGKRGSVVL